MIELKRRTFLGGAATLIELPWLEALAPKRAEAAGAIAYRLLVYYLRNGIESAHWIPANTGSDYELPPALSPLAPLRQHVLLASGLANAPADLDDGHLCGTASLLTCTPIPIREERLENGVSLDQLAVQSLHPETRWPSLQLGLEPGLSVGG